jgi:hypothetical protein
MAAGDDSSVALGTPSGNADTRLTANGDHRQVVSVGNAGDLVAGVNPWGGISVDQGSQTVFYDSWSGPLDTTDKWTVTGNTPTLTGGVLTMSATASSYNALRTKDTVRPNAGFTYVANGVILEATAAVGAGRFWGLGTTATTPAAAVLAQDGAGFEIDQATGGLLAVTYNTGVRTTVATLTRPADGLTHRYAMHFRVTAAYWYIDNLQVPVASTTWPNHSIAELPALIVRQNAATFTGTPTFTGVAHLTGDTSRQGQTIIDPVVGTRMARVTPGGALVVSSNVAQTVGTAAGNIFRARVAPTAITTSTALVAAPGTGLSLYLTDVSVSNAGATLNTVTLYDGATAVLDVVAAASGGGGSLDLTTPIKLTAATALNYTTSAASDTRITVTGFVAA